MGAQVTGSAEWSDKHDGSHLRLDRSPHLRKTLSLTPEWRIDVPS